MNDPNFATALTLLKLALPLLDRSAKPDAQTVGCHVQTAIDLAEGKTPMSAGEMLDPDLEAILWRKAAAE